MDIDDIIHRLRQWADAYPEDIFRPLSENERITIHGTYPGYMDRIAATMGRHIGEQMRAIADDLEKCKGEVP